MPFSDDVNKEALGISQADVARGPRVGFQDAFETSWQAQVRASAMFGIEAAFDDENSAQVEAMRKAGIENIPTLAPGEAYTGSSFLRTAKYYTDGGEDADREQLNSFDKRVEEIRKLNPGLNVKTSREMWESVRDKGAEADRKAESMRTTGMGMLGSVAGGALASMNPRTDPLNFITLGVGGVGKTAAARIGTEMGAQGVIETINQVTGVQDQREMMGLSTGFMDGATRVASTVVGAGVLRGIGEGAVFAGRRFFKNTPNDPAPTPPRQLMLEYKPDKDPGVQSSIDSLSSGGSYMPEILPRSVYTGSRIGDARTVLDVDYVASRLQSWEGEAPGFIPPKTDTAIPKPYSDYIRTGVELKGPGKSIDSMARDVDPETFRIYDKLAAEKETYKTWIEQLRPSEQKALSVVQDMTDEIDEVKALMQRSGNKARKKQAVQLAELTAKRDAAADKIRKSDTPDMAKLRERVIQNDLKMRDMAPVVSRAYAHAKGEWDLGAEDRALVRKMIRDGSTRMPESERPILTDTYENTKMRFERTMVDRVPHLQQAPRVEAKMREGADAADYVQAIIKENMDILDKGIEQYRSSLNAVLSDQGDGTVRVLGTDHVFSLDNDRVAVPQADGAGHRMATWREVLEDNAETEADLKAVSSCSIK